jgi:D-alanyl-D-alanine carboxypeptidase
MRALVGGKGFNADYQRQWIESPEPVDPNNPKGQKYGYGISLITFGPNKVYFHGGEMQDTTPSWATIQSTMSRWSYGPT